MTVMLDAASIRNGRSGRIIGERWAFSGVNGTSCQFSFDVAHRVRSAASNSGSVSWDLVYVAIDDDATGPYFTVNRFDHINGVNG